MADQLNVDDLRAGANQLHSLMRAIKAVSDGTVGAEAGTDAREYVAIADLISASIQVNLNSAGPARREGYLRALTHMFALNVDGGGYESEDDAVEITADAFAKLDPRRSRPGEFIHDRPSPLPENEIDLVFDAAGEIECLLRRMRDELDELDEISHEPRTLLCSAVKTMKGLNSIVLSIAGREGLKYEEMHLTVHGAYPATAVGEPSGG